MSSPRRGGLDQHLGQRRGALQAQVQALAGDRVDAVGGVAQQGRARRRQPLGELQAERIGEDRPLDRRPRPGSRRSGAAGGRGTSPAGRPSAPRRGARLSVQTRLARSSVSGRMANGPPRQEILVRHALVRPRQPHGRHHAGLRIVPADRADPGLARGSTEPRPSAPTTSGARQHPAVGQGDRAPRAARTRRSATRAGASTSMPAADHRLRPAPARMWRFSSR